MQVRVAARQTGRHLHFPLRLLLCLREPLLLLLLMLLLLLLLLVTGEGISPSSRSVGVVATTVWEGATTAGAAKAAVPLPFFQGAGFPEADEETVTCKTSNKTTTSTQKKGINKS